MRIKEVEEIVGITRKNIRFYEKEGLLTPSREQENSYRDYSDSDVERLKLIKLLRKLDMPISSISELLENRISLKESLHLQTLLLDEKSVSIGNAKRVCQMIEEKSSNLNDIDIDSFLREIEFAEENRPILVNIVNKDIKKKYQESFLSCVIMALVLVLLAFLLYYSYNNGSISRTILFILVAILLIVIVGYIVSLISRLREIKNGEEDDLSNY